MHEIIILSYHNILESLQEGKTSEQDYYTISIGSFEKQLEIIEQNAIHLLSPNELHAKADSNTPSIVLTFDDGHESHYYIAKSILKKRQISALFFPVSKEVGQLGKMTWKQLQELERNGHEIGSHSHSHKDFKKLKKHEIAKEIIDSTHFFSQNLQKSNAFFAFPYGSYSSESLEIVRKKGFKKGLTTDGIPNKNSKDFLLHRININRSISESEFARIITGDKKYYAKRSAHLKYQKTLRKTLGPRAENFIKHLIKRV